MSASLTWTLNYQRKITHIHHGSNLADVVTYAGELYPYTRARLTRATVTLQQPLTTFPEKAGEYASTDLYAKIFLRDNAEEKRYCIILPAPVDSMFEEVTGRGWRVLDSVGQQLATYYSTFSGLTLEFVDGWLCGHR